ncbi:MAG: type III polyketide synthase [Cyclobacteriaceae bacterium]|nr:type III polyketide synthase [Cyclobacteriaceae bacterium]
MNACISAIGTANPANKISQDRIADFMVKAHQLKGREKDRLLALYRATGIRHRYSVLKDYGLDHGDYEFYSKQEDLEPFPTTAQRNILYQQEALNLAKAAVTNCLPDQVPGEITHLITVSCTGLYAPGLDIELVEALGLSTHVQRTAINFMGCYAAFSAIKIGQAICRADNQAQVLIVCLELCSIHFQKDIQEDFILSNALFGDGAAALKMESSGRGSGLEILATHGEILPEGTQEMAWQVGNLGFEMRLSRYVPDLIANGIEKLTGSLMCKGPWKLSEIDFFAIHPGGKRILESIQQALNITSHQNRFAYQILRDFGNMSSPTILFVLKEIWNNLKKEDQGKRILSFAFGPGLTMESMILQVDTAR